LRDALVDEVPDERGHGGEPVNIFSHINTFCTNIFTRMVNIFSRINMLCTNIFARMSVRVLFSLFLPRSPLT
jgi:hypothetical protein